MDQKVLTTMSEVLACTDEAKRQDLMAKSNGLLAAHFSHPANQADLHELAFDLINTQWADVMKDDITRSIIEVKTVGLGDPDYIEEDLRGMTAYWQGKGGQILSDIMRYERSTMPKEEMVGAIDMHIDQLRLNFWGTFQRLVTQIREKLSQLPVERLISLIQAGVVTSPYFGQFAGATLSSAQVDGVVNRVTARSKGGVVLMGTETALTYLAEIGLDYGDNVKEQVFRTGKIGVYKGKTVVQVENFENFEGDLVLPDDEIWIVGNNAGRLTYYGDAAKVQQLQRSGFYTRWETARDAGILLYGASRGRVGRLKLT